MDNEDPTVQDAQDDARDILIAARQSKEAGQDGKRGQRKFKIAHSYLIAVLLLILSLQIIGIVLFTNGFLLTRLVLEHKSVCASPPIDISDGIGASTEGSESCWHPKTFDKAVVIIIDALRYDFTVPSSSQQSGVTKHHYHDALQLLYETAVEHPSNAVLRPFIADAPTTTLQRLKGLTTGTLPTFIDAGSNFAGTAIDEDNLVAQLAAAGKSVVQLGDDTWHQLFPGLFNHELTKPFDSFNVWDLFTVDNGVSKHLFPLLHPSNATKWDVIIGHYLGVDHAGHRYGPDHPAMAEKLREMDNVLRRVISSIDDDTLLVVMGDHGMDVKGDHGGESDDEVQAALWMYTKRKIFGRRTGVSSAPPSTAKERAVAQIDLVPTLALLLGLPIPFNNLGRPIEEAFVGPEGNDLANLAAVNRLTAAQVHRYQGEYAVVRKPDPEALRVPDMLWGSAIERWKLAMSLDSKITKEEWETVSQAFQSYLEQNLEVCKSLWSRFDLVNIAGGLSISAIALAIIATYASAAGKEANLSNIQTVLVGIVSLIGGACIGYIIGLMFPVLGTLRATLSSGAIMCSITFARALPLTMKFSSSLLPHSLWSWLCSVSVILLAVGFGANSFTIWEDEILLFFLATFGVLMFTQSFRLKSSSDRAFACYHSVIFTVMIRLASLSRLCREEQMPYCKSTFYASAASSTSAPWQLAIPYIIGVVLPTTIKTHFDRTSSYQGSAPFWIGIAFRGTLFLIAAFWTLDAAADAKWLENQMSEDTLKNVRMYLAQLVLAIAAGAGVATFGWQSPLLGIVTSEPRASQPTLPPPSKSSAKSNGTESLTPQRPQITLYGTNNLYGSHFAILPFTVLLIPLLLLQKPMGQAALACIATAILSLLELLHLLRQPRLHPSAALAPISTKTPAKTAPQDAPSPSPTLGATLLALLAHFAYFKTGHQAALASLQWDAAFVPLRTLRYPWAPLFVLLNTFAGQILCAAAVPALVLWRRPFGFATVVASKGAGGAAARDRRHARLLADVARAVLRHALVYAALHLAAAAAAAHLRRHLMLYRVFSPRWMLAAIGMVVAQGAAVLVGVTGVRWSVAAPSELFGW